MAFLARFRRPGWRNGARSGVVLERRIHQQTWGAVMMLAAVEHEIGDQGSSAPRAAVMCKAGVSSGKLPAPAAPSALGLWA